MKRSLVAFAFASLVALGAARAQDEPKPDAPKTDAPKSDAPPKDAPKTDAPKDAPKPDAVRPAGAAKAPDPAKAAPAGEPLAAGTVPRKDLFPLEDGRRWRYELRAWLQTSNPDESAQDETEAPRLHRLEVAVAEPTKVEGREARCLEYRLDDEPAQRAYYVDEGGSVLCSKRILGAGEQAHDYLLNPPQPTLQGDLGVGTTWTWTGKVGSANGKQRFEVLREERVTTKAGTFDTVVIRVTFSGEDDSNGVSTKWLAPNVGIVREETEVKADAQVYRTVATLTKMEDGKKK